MHLMTNIEELFCLIVISYFFSIKHNGMNYNKIKFFVI